MRTPSRRLGAALLGAVLALLLSFPVLAHADLVSSSPEDGARLETPPPVVTLTFSEGLDAGKSSIRLAGPEGDVASGKPARDGARTMRLSGLALAPGDYVVKWVAAADDGHIERGEVAFSVTAPAPSPAAGSPTPDAGASTAPSSAPSEAPAASVAPTAAAPATGEPSPAADPPPASTTDGGTDVLLPIALGLVLVAVVGVFVMRRSRGA